MYAVIMFFSLLLLLLLLWAWKVIKRHRKMFPLVLGKLFTMEMENKERRNL
jgi:hypothetical protein